MTPPVDAAQALAARSAWARVGARLAANGRMRVSRTGRSFERRGERDVTPELPSQVAAVLLYDTQGRAPVFVVDLDSSKGGRETVERDLAAIEALMEASGLRSRFSDASGSGGRHLYVPLRRALPHYDARRAAILLEELFESVDSMPMRGATDGCIRPPGAWHRRGGHQTLTGSVDDAEAALDAPNDELAWKRFFDELTRRHQKAVPSTTSELRGRAPSSPTVQSPLSSSAFSATPRDEEPQLPGLRGFNAPDATYQAIARTGEYDDRCYATPSEARQGVIWACVASGWAFSDVVRRLHDGTWPGLAGFYARYAEHARHGAVQRDWRKAIDLEKRRRESGTKESVRRTTTSGRKTQAGAQEDPGPGPATRSQVERFVREWLVAVELLNGPTSDLTLRSLLTAMAQMAVLSGTTEIRIGNRGLAIAAATDNGTVSRLITSLLAEPSDRGLIDLVHDARGIHARVIKLRIPPLLAASCAERPWRRGRIHGIRAPFRELGRAAAFVYDALGQLDAPTGGRELAAQARLSPSAAYEALATLAAWGLAENTGRGWVRGDASLAWLAEHFGVDDAVAAQVERYRAERRAWWEWLVARGHLDPAWVINRTTPPPEPPPPSRPTWSDDTSCVELLVATLGAQIISCA